MKPVLIFIVLYSCALVSSCGQSGNQESVLKSGAKKQEAKTSQNHRFLKFKKHEIFDREGGNMLAFTCLIPDGWTASDKLYWEVNDATQPIRYRGTFKNEQNGMAIYSYPEIRSYYSMGPTGQGGYPPPSGVIAGLKEFIRQERGMFQYSVIAEKLISNKTYPGAYEGAGYREGYSQSGIVRISYAENNQTIEEEFFTQFDVSTLSSQGYAAMMHTLWSASNLFSVKAPKSKLEECRKIAMTVKASSRATLPFYNKYLQVVKMLSEEVYRRIYTAGQISKIFSQTSDQISKSITDSYWQTQKSSDRMYNQYSDYTRGINRYEDGSGLPLHFPSDYNDAWVNDRGDYLLGDSRTFDPNTTMTGNWRQLERK